MSAKVIYRAKCREW